MSEAIQIVVPSLVLFAAYLWMAGRTEWPWTRTACFAAGLAVVGAGIGFDDISLAVHMAGHGEVAKRELAGDTANSVELVVPQLRYPLPVPGAAHRNSASSSPAVA